MPAPVYVVNTGIITAIGNDTAACLHSLQTGHGGIGPMQILSSHWAGEIPAGEIALSNEVLAARSGAPAHWPRTALLSAIAAGEAWRPFGSTGGNPLPVGFFNATTVGGMDKTEAFYKAYAIDKTSGRTEDYVYHECGAVTALVAAHHGFSGFKTTISTACSSSANSIALAAQMIGAGLIDVAVAGGGDALCRFTINGFNTLGILDRLPCQPFDAGRRGLNLGEGAAYLTLMSERALMAWNAKPVCVLNGWGNANDAYHQTASSPDGEGAKLAMEAALRTAVLQPRDIDYINLHGTGTPNNDSAEGRAVEALFGIREVPPASSTKAFTGHTLGAAGGVEAVFSVLAIQHGIIPPNLRWEQQMDDVSFKPVTEVLHRQVEHVLSNSFGFGGASSSLILSKC